MLCTITSSHLVLPQMLNSVSWESQLACQLFLKCNLGQLDYFRLKTIMHHRLNQVEEKVAPTSNSTWLTSHRVNLEIQQDNKEASAEIFLTGNHLTTKERLIPSYCLTISTLSSKKKDNHCPNLSLHSTSPKSIEQLQFHLMKPAKNKTKSKDSNRSVLDDLMVVTIW